MAINNFIPKESAEDRYFKEWINSHERIARELGSENAPFGDAMRMANDQFNRGEPVNFGKNLMLAARKAEVEKDVRQTKDPSYIIPLMRASAGTMNLDAAKNNPYFSPWLENPDIEADFKKNDQVFGWFMNKVGLWDAHNRVKVSDNNELLGESIINNGYNVTGIQHDQLNKNSYASMYYSEDKDDPWYKKMRSGVYENAGDMIRRGAKSWATYSAIRTGSAWVGRGIAFIPGGQAVGAVVTGAGQVAPFVAGAVSFEDMYRQQERLSVANLSMIKDDNGNRLTPEEIKNYSQAIAMVSTPMEFVGELLKVPGLKVVPNAILKNVSKSNMSKWLGEILIKNGPARVSLLKSSSNIFKKIGTPAAGEALTEFSQELSEVLLTNRAMERSNDLRGTKFELTPFGEAFRDSLEAGYKGGLVGGFWGGVHGVGGFKSNYKSNYMQEVYREPVKATQGKELLYSLGEATNSTSEKAAETYYQNNKELFESIGASSFRVSPDDIQTTFGNKANEIAGILGITEAEFQNKITNSEEIFLNTTEVAKVIIGRYKNTEIWNQLSDIARIGQNEMTYRQAKAKDISVGNLIVEDEIEKSLVVQKITKQADDMKRQLSQLGATTKESNALYRMMVASLSRISEDFNITDSAGLELLPSVKIQRSMDMKINSDVPALNILSRRKVDTSKNISREFNDSLPIIGGVLNQEGVYEGSELYNSSSYDSVDIKVPSITDNAEKNKRLLNRFYPYFESAEIITDEYGKYLRLSKYKGGIENQIGSSGSATFTTAINNGKMEREAVINLFANKNVSTVFHELGHLFLNEYAFLMNNLKEEDISTRAVENWSIIVKTLNVGEEQIESIDAGDGVTVQKVNFTKDQQEKFARMFEQYLYEGKSPSAGLRRVFKNFREWMSNIYESILSGNGAIEEISDEVRMVFDRILATDSQINTEMRIRKSSTITKHIENVDEFFSQVNWEGITERGKMKMLQQRLSEIKKMNTEEAREFEKKARADITEVVENIPVYRIMEDIKNGSVVLDFPPEFNKLNTQSLIREVGPSIVEKINPDLHGTEGVLDPQSVANNYGFLSVENMTSSLINALPIGEEIEGRVHNMMESYVLPTDEMIIQTMQEAIDANESNLDVIAEALNEFYRKNGLEKISNQVREEAIFKARETISGKTLIEARSDSRKHRAKINSISNIVLEEMKKEFPNNNKIENLMKQQLEHQVMATELAKFQEEVEGNRSLLQGISKARLGVKSKRKIASRELGVLKGILRSLKVPVSITGREASEIMPIGDWMSVMQEEFGVQHKVLSDVDSSPIIQTLIPIINLGTPIVGMTVEQYRETITAIQMIKKTGEIIDDMMIGDKNQTVTEVKEQLQGDLMKNVGVNYTSKNYKKVSEKVSKLADMLNSWIIGTENVIWEADGGKFEGNFRKQIWSKITEGSNNYEILDEVTQSQMSDVFSEYSKKELFSMQTEVISIPSIGSTGDSLTRSQIIGIQLLMGSESGMQKLRDGEGWSLSDLNDITKHLTKKDFNAILKLRKMFADHWDQRNKLEIETVGKSLGKINPMQVITQHGIDPGGYAPVYRDPARTTSTTGGSFPTWNNSIKTRQNHTRSRTKSAYPIMTDLDSMLGYFHNTNMELAYRKIGMDLSRIMSDKSFQEVAHQTIGKDKFQEIFDAVEQTITETRNNPREVGAAAMRYLRTSAISSMMSGKLTVAFQQPAGFFSSMAIIGPKVAIAGMEHLASPMKTWNFVAEKSVYMRNRPKTRERDVRDYLKDTSVLQTGGFPVEIAKRMGVAGFQTKRIVDETTRQGFRFIAMMDMWVSNSTWITAYSQALREGKTEADAISFGDSMVRQSQGSGLTFDQARFQREGGEFRKAFTQFTTPGIALYRLIWRNVQSIKRGDTNIVQGCFNMAVAMLAQGALAEILAGRGPEDDEEWGKWIAKESLSFGISGIPVIRELYQVSSGETRSVSSPIMQPIETTGRVFNSARKAINGEDVNADTLVKDMLKMTAYLTRFPQQGFIWGYNFMDGVENGNWTLSDLLKFRPSKR